MTILNLAEIPNDPIEALVWADGVEAEVQREMDLLWRRLYYEARLTGRFDSALALRQHSRKRALAFTRGENEARGRSISRWGDGY
jgi:hypothetical protein